MALESLVEIIMAAVEIGADEYPRYAVRRRHSAWRVLLTSFLALLVLFTVLVLLPGGAERSWADRMYFVFGVSAIGAVVMVLLYWLYLWLAVRKARKRAQAERANAEQAGAEQVQAEQVQAERAAGTVDRD